MAKVRVQIWSAGAKAVLTDSGVAADLGRRADAIRDRAVSMTSPDKMRNEPYMSEVDSSGTRARARVWTSSDHGIYSNNRHNTLLKSLDAGR